MCILFFVFILLDNSFEKKTRKQFAVICISTAILSVVDCVDYTLSQMMYTTFWHMLSSVAVQFFRLSIVFLLTKIVDRDNDYNPRLSIPLSAFLVLLIINLPTGLLFSYNEINQFKTGPFWLLTPFIYAFYFVVMIVFTTKYAKNSKASERVIVLLIIISSTVSMFVETVLRAVFLFDSTILVCAVMYYLFLHTHIYKRDELTKLYNRRNFYLDAEELQKKENFIVVSIDLNNLKYINDNFGHKEGDLAITTVVKEIDRHMNMNCSLYRVGGDEFIMICRKMKFQDVEKMFEDVDACLNYTPYSVAYGIAIYTLDSNFQKVLNMADKKMYENKRMKKEQQKEQQQNKS